MPACTIEAYQDSPQAREELARWLVIHAPYPLDEREWVARLGYWWDSNPFATAAVERGWVLRDEGSLAGFMALIPAAYSVGGVFTPAMNASSWCVAETHRNASLPMLMKLRRLAATMPMADTTPTPDVQVMLQQSGWMPATSIHRHFVPLGLFGLPWRARWPQLPAGKKITRDPAEVRSIARNFQNSDRIEKWVTPEYLRWFAASTIRRHEFIGVLDEAGCLTSYLFLTPAEVRGITGWLEVDHFSTCEDFSELHALVGEIVRNGARMSGGHYLTLTSFPGDTTCDSVRALLRRAARVTHHFAIPEALKALPKHSVLAEGDWGL